MKDNPWRSYPINIVRLKIEEMIRKMNPRKINILDACFGLNKGWRKAVLNLLVRQKLHSAIWLEMRIDLVDKDDIALLKALDVEVNFGVESFSEQMLLIMGKTSSPQRYLRNALNVLSCLNEEDIPYKIYLIHNYPGETNLTFKRSVENLRSFVAGQRRMSGIISGQKYSLFPGSLLYNDINKYKERYGTVVKDAEWWKLEKNQHEAATNILASKYLDYDKLSFDYWVKDFNNINKEIGEKMSTKWREYWAARSEYRTIGSGTAL